MKNWKGDLFFPILFSSQENRFVPFFARYGNFRPFLIFWISLPLFSITCNPLRPFWKKWNLFTLRFWSFLVFFTTFLVSVDPFKSMLSPFYIFLSHLDIFSLFSWLLHHFNLFFGSKIAFFGISYFFRLGNEKNGENSTCAKFSGENFVF